MKTIILCGGKGTRMREETEFKPKPMVMVGYKPMLWHIMKIYAHYGYNHFIFALGYKGEKIRHYLWGLDNFNIIFGDTGEETPHGERVLMLKKHIKEDNFMVTYGDGVADINIKDLVKFHKEKDAIVTISGVHTTSRWGLTKIDKDGYVIEFNQKPLLSDYINGGFMVFKKEFFDYLQTGDMIEHAIARLIDDKQVALYKHEGFWFGMDTYKDYKLLNKMWEENPKWKIW